MVYIIDQTSVGRGTQENLGDFPLRIGSTAEVTQDAFTAPETANDYPQSQNHTQWPGSGLIGDPIFNAFEATFIPLTNNATAQQLSMRASGCKMLQMIGKPSFLVSHSIGATHPILLSNDCPEYVAGSINLDPATTPFGTYVGGDPGMQWLGKRLWGFTDTYLR